MWPDVGVKSSPIFSKSCQCSYYIRVRFFKIAQKVANLLGFFCKRFCCQELLKIAQSLSWVVSHLALIIGTLCHALGREFKPRWRQTLFWTQAQHLCFIHDYIWFIWFDTIIYLSNLSSELWNRKLKIKEIYFKKNRSIWSHCSLNTIMLVYRIQSFPVSCVGLDPKCNSQGQRLVPFALRRDELQRRHRSLRAWGRPRNSSGWRWNRDRRERNQPFRWRPI